jgi:hypothetical protein
VNERIKELRNLAWKEIYGVDPDDPRVARAHAHMEEGMAKFAELIIKECTNVLRNTVENQCQTESEKFGRTCGIMDINDHFGIVEPGDTNIKLRQ